MKQRWSVAAAVGRSETGQAVFWGGCSGYFADLDGHLWEVAWQTPGTLTDDGSIRVPRRA
jgi:uncharacterized protein